MAAVQMWRTMVPVRGDFFENSLTNWLERAIPDAPLSPEWLSALKKLGVEKVSAREALLEFERVTGRRVYDLPIEQLCGQLTVAFESAFDQPEQFPCFLLLVVGPGADKELARLTEFMPQVSGPSESAMGYSQARSALTRLGQMRIDGFQISAGGAWRRHLRLVVLWLSMTFSWAITAGSLGAQKLDFTIGVKFLFYSLLIGFIGAYIAMLLRDVAAIVELKRRQS
jgi:hypothetical protein